MQEPLNHLALWTGLFGGLALFLFGMDTMTSALKRVAGDCLKNLLGSKAEHVVRVARLPVTIVKANSRVAKS
jgi:Na+/phosphate symporter